MYACNKKILSALLCLISTQAVAANLDEIIELRAQAEKEQLSIKAGLKPSPEAISLKNNAEQFASVEIEDTFLLMSLSRFSTSFRAKIETDHGFIWVNNRQPIIQFPWVVKTTFDGGIIITDGKKEKKMILTESEPGNKTQQSKAVMPTMPPMPTMPVMPQQNQGGMSPQNGAYTPPQPIIPR